MRNLVRNAGFAGRGRKFFASCSGQAILEWALIVPLALFLIVNIVNYGALAFACITVSNAARAGASYMSQGPMSLNLAGYPTQIAVTNVVKADMGALPNGASATVNVCSNKNGSADSTTPYNCLTPIFSGSTNYTDPEGSTSTTIGTVQVTYTYCPLISNFSFPALGIGSLLPSCSTNGQNNITGGVSITRVAAMRLL